MLIQGGASPLPCPAARDTRAHLHPTIEPLFPISQDPRVSPDHLRWIPDFESNSLSLSLSLTHTHTHILFSVTTMMCVMDTGTDMHTAQGLEAAAKCLLKAH